MKRLSLFLTLLVLPLGIFAQSDTKVPAAQPEDVASVDAIIAALYDVISGPAGEKRDWDRMKSLFVPEGRLIPTFKRQDGKTGYLWWSTQEYIDRAGANLERDGFFEVEVSRKQETYGTMVHMFSTYESRRKADDEKPFVRGINSIQLMYDSERWWIVNVFWLGETPGNPIPAKYLK